MCVYLFVYLWCVQLCVQCLSWPRMSSSPSKSQPHTFSFTLSQFGWPTHELLLKTWDAVTALTHRHIHKHTSVWVYRHTPVHMLAPSSRFHFQETSVLCKKTNGYLFNCYPQMRKYPSSSPHDDFPSKVSSRLEFSPHTPLTLSLSICLSLFLSHCSSFTVAFTHTDTQTHKHIYTQA